MKTAVVRARVDENLKLDVEGVLSQLGLTMSEAIGLYMAQIKLRHGIPFDIRVPNKETLEAFRDTDQKRNLIRSKNAKDMFKKLKI